MTVMQYIADLPHETWWLGTPTPSDVVVVIESWAMRPCG